MYVHGREEEGAAGFSLGSGPIVFEQPAKDRHRRESSGDLGQDEGWHVLRHDATEGIGEAPSYRNRRIGETGGRGKPVGRSDV